MKIGIEFMSILNSLKDKTCADYAFIVKYAAKNNRSKLE